MTDSLIQLRATNLDRVELWHPGFPDDHWNITDWSNAMAGECGEACNVAKKIRRIDTGAIGRPTELDRAALVKKMAEEVADTIIYADLLMAKEGLPLWPYIVQKFNRTGAEMGFPQRLHE